jgi:putative ABC transport system permease protein
MSWFFRKLMWWMHRRQKDAELREELRFHLEEEADERRSEGMAADQAMRAARRDLGNVTLLREDVRTLWTWGFLEQLARDSKYALRGLRRQPSFACAAITILVLGVGATTAVFSVLRGVLITPLPYRDPEQLVLLRSQLPGSASAPMLTSIEFAALRAQTDVFESVAAAVESDGNLTAPEQMAPLSAAAVSENFLDTLGVAPVLGRAVQRGDAGRSINISYDVWQRYFHGDPSIVGRTIEMNNRSVNVVGILPHGFKAYLGSDVVMPPQVDLLYFRGSGYDDDPFRGNVVIARMRRGVRIATARAAVDTVAKNLAAEHPGSYRTGPVRLSLAPIEAEVVSGARPSLVAAAGAVALVLVVACANLTNLLLARASARTREIAVRIAIGAGRRDIIRQLVVEALVVGAIGAAGGWVLAQWGVSALLALAPAALPRRESIAVDGGVAVFAIALAFVCAVTVSLVPARQATRLPVSARLTRDPARAGRTRGMLVAAQLALSVVLLVGAGLMARAFVSLRSVPLGFDPRQAATLHISLTDRRFGGGTIEEARAKRQVFYEHLTDQVREVSGVHAVGTGFPVPLSGVSMSQRVSLGPAMREREIDGFIALAGYLEALDVPLIAGRYFTPSDNDRPAVIIDERLARELWPTESAVGQRLLIVKAVAAPQWTDVVGVVTHVQARSPRDVGPPQVWMTYGVRSYSQLDLVVRAADPTAAVTPIISTVQQLGAGRPVRNIRLLEDYVREASADTRFALFVIGVLAVLAVVLAAVGLYAIVAYAMARRRREMAVRLALGASRRGLVALVLGEGAIWTFAGLAAGLAGAAALSRYLESLLFRVGRYDALTFTTVAALLTVVALAASAVPALRAARVDPMLALRTE